MSGARRSIYLTLGAAIVLAVAAVMSLHALYLYFQIKHATTDQMQASARGSNFAL